MKQNTGRTECLVSLIDSMTYGSKKKRAITSRFIIGIAVTLIFIIIIFGIYQLGISLGGLILLYKKLT